MDDQPIGERVVDRVDGDGQIPGPRAGVPRLAPPRRVRRVARVSAKSMLRVFSALEKGQIAGFWNICEVNYDKETDGIRDHLFHTGAHGNALRPRPG